ncbi:hypothetical protein B0J11DRAFT_500205 [Dendryphion nanum]|uniref:RING-type domain-containing protein n=1 Tax=Dendryphion nanum TaxID=256645 RepID=A0A9P9EIZ5_9PLEO|nr:hypothetical protein B0J11DRAFT_500205 [Dendryphion nanum]
MTPSSNRGAVKKPRKHRPLFLGNKFVNIIAGIDGQVISVHQDLLCARSPYFKDRLQKVRKKIYNEECSICHDFMHPETQPITWCEACGNNFHRKCKSEWAANSCPMCRAPDSFNEKSAQDIQCSDLNSEGLEVYVQWLYSGTIPNFEEESVFTQKEIRSLQGCAVAEILQDDEFREAMFGDFLRQNRLKSFGIDEFSRIIYGITNGPCALREIFVEFCIAIMEPGDLKDGLNQAFLLDIARAALMNLHSKGSTSLLATS